MLVDKDPRVLDILDDQDRTPLHAAAHAGSKQSVRTLLSKGAKVQRLTTEIEGDIVSIGSAVHAAAATGHADCLRLLVAAASPDAISGGDCFDRSPLHLAATAGHANCLKVPILCMQPLIDPHIHVLVVPMCCIIVTTSSESVPVLVCAVCHAIVPWSAVCLILPARYLAIDRCAIENIYILVLTGVHVYVGPDFSRCSCEHTEQLGCIVAAPGCPRTVIRCSPRTPCQWGRCWYR